MITGFPLEVWLASMAGLAAIIAVDLVLVGRRTDPAGLRGAVVGIAVYVTLAALFAAGLWMLGPGPVGAQFVAGYLTEYTLSVDNLLVFVIIMARFAVPPAARDKALFIGIVGSMLLRLVFILAGAGILAVANWVFYIFAAILFYTAIRLALDKGGDIDFEDSSIVRGVNRVVRTSPRYDGAKIFTRIQGRRTATPLLIVICVISVANVAFAVDSLPAIFGLTQDAYVIVMANAFALMGLRQLFFIVGALLQRLAYLNIGLAVVLGFIGVKMVLEALHDSNVEAIGPVDVPHISVSVSLGVIVSVLGITAVVSTVARRRARKRGAPLAAGAPLPREAGPVAAASATSLDPVGRPADETGLPH